MDAVSIRPEIPAAGRIGDSCTSTVPGRCSDCVGSTIAHLWIEQRWRRVDTSRDRPSSASFFNVPRKGQPATLLASPASNPAGLPMVDANPKMSRIQDLGFVCQHPIAADALSCHRQLAPPRCGTSPLARLDGAAMTIRDLNLCNRA
ncbi:hypothetical protein CSOJ01_07380 [Colletotrichum sojae]|uniref:Uncharacterized protein n=1 Tax=Colletotrichum sojae TaxID=2175907 RepID=A0A8H6J9D1_9PEZI|nr:hypothetical protein CSOJ01_07380 [Colletotrichum sojae]